MGKVAVVEGPLLDLLVMVETEETKQVFLDKQQAAEEEARIMEVMAQLRGVALVAPVEMELADLEAAPVVPPEAMVR